MRSRSSVRRSTSASSFSLSARSSASMRLRACSARMRSMPKPSWRANVKREIDVFAGEFARRLVIGHEFADQLASGHQWNEGERADAFPLHGGADRLA